MEVKKYFPNAYFSRYFMQLVSGNILITLELHGGKAHYKELADGTNLSGIQCVRCDVRNEHQERMGGRR